MNRNTSNITLSKPNNAASPLNARELEGLSPVEVGEALRSCLEAMKGAFLGDPGIVVNVSPSSHPGGVAVDVAAGVSGWLVIDSSGTDYRARIHNTFAGALAQVSTIVSTQSNGTVTMADSRAAGSPAFAFHGYGPLGPRTVVMTNLAA